jgi:hypothetical protein
VIANWVCAGTGCAYKDGTYCRLPAKKDKQDVFIGGNKHSRSGPFAARTMKVTALTRFWDTDGGYYVFQEFGRTICNGTTL